MSFQVGYSNTTPTPAGFNLPLFQQEYILEYIRTSHYNKYMGTGPDMPIQLMSELKKGGESMTIPLLARLKKRGVVGNMPLVGREEQLARWNHKVTVEYWRNGVSLTERDEQFVFANALGQVRPALMRWSKEQLRDHITDALFSVSPYITMAAPLVNPDPSQVLPGDPAIVNIKALASGAQLNTWLTNNKDRACFGTTDANIAAGAFATSIGNVTGGTNKAGAELLANMKLKAKTCSPHITPIQVGEDGEEYFINFCDSYTFRQYQKDPDIIAFNREARAREGDGHKRNPLLTGGSLEYDGVIIREIVEMGPHSFDGGGLPLVGRNALVGAQAVCVAIGADPEFREKKEDDYGHIKGIAIRECLGVNKLQKFDPGTGSYVDHAVVTGFSALQ